MGTWWLLDGWQKFGRIQSNRPVSWINCRVNSRIFLLISSGKSLLPYINSCVKTSFEGLVSPNGRTNARTPAKRSRRWVSKDGQSNKLSRFSVITNAQMVCLMGFHLYRSKPITTCAILTHCCTAIFGS